MRVRVEGTGKTIELGVRDLIGRGGEATVYARGEIAYKLYHDPARMPPAGKLEELRAIADPFIVKPERLLLGERDRAVGYTARFVANAWALCQLFPPAFRRREGLSPPAILTLVRKLKQRVEGAHAAGALIVDLNEMNFLVSRDFAELYAIDVDSYQTASYRAPALLESIRDWQAKEGDWSRLSDWFSFAVVSFQMFVGVHPFKGRYQGRRTELCSRLPSDADDDAFALTRRRMQAQVSVFHPEVTLPDAAFSLDAIPTAYRAWYQALFEQGRRCPPPLESDAALVALSLSTPTAAPRFAPAPAPGPAPTAAVLGAQLEISEIGRVSGQVLGLFGNRLHLVVVSDQGMWLDGKRLGGTAIGSSLPGAAPCCGFAPRSGRPVLAWRPLQGVGAAGATRLFDLSVLSPLAFSMAAEELADHDGRLYLRAGERVHEVVLTDTGSRLIASAREVAQTLPHATRLYSGVIVQRMLGTTVVSLLARPGVAQQLKLAELDRYRVLEARYQGSVLMVIGEHAGRYDRLVFRFDETGGHDLRVVAGVSPAGLNFATLDSGVCVCLAEDGRLEVFDRHSGSPRLCHVEDPALRSDMQLCGHGGALLASQGSRVLRLRLRG